jgi:hypothetical protein
VASFLMSGSSLNEVTKGLGCHGSDIGVSSSSPSLKNRLIREVVEVEGVVP